MDTSIICLGNRLVPRDSAGPAVYDRLQKYKIPENITVIEGGTAGLKLLPLLEKGGRVIFVDSVSGFTDEGKVIVLTAEEIVKMGIQPLNGHELGLPYVLAVLPDVSTGKLPEEIVVIGIEGNCDSTLIQKAADLCLSIAAAGINS